MAEVPCKIALRWSSLDLTNDKSTLVQVIAWCRQVTSHYLNQCWLRSMMSYGVTRPQVNPLHAEFFWQNVTIYLNLYHSPILKHHWWQNILMRAIYFPSNKEFSITKVTLFSDAFSNMLIAQQNLWLCVTVDLWVWYEFSCLVDVHS